MSLSFTIYINSYCHLCEEMLLAIRQHLQDTSYQLDIVDIEEQSELESRYGELIPVLLCGETEVCHYHLDYAALDECCQ